MMFSRLLFVSLFVPLFSVSAENLFPDVDSSHIYYEALEYGKTQNIIEGYASESDNFRPERIINRAEFLKILFSALESDQSMIDNCYLPHYANFPDVNEDQWFYHYVCMAYRHQVIEGYEDGTFRPGQKITAAEAMKILSLSFLKDSVGTSLRSNIWFEPYVWAMTSKNAIPNEIPSSGANITRAQMMEMVWRLRAEKENEPGHTFTSFMPGGGSGNYGKGFDQAFFEYGLKTNTAIRDLKLDQVLDGGPGKDEIPALSDPRFTDSDRVDWLNADSLGVLVQGAEESKFYPYDILYWHEIVNDEIDGRNIAVTFCPLCGSAIVYNRVVGGDVLSFGVSGKLWQSNMLMYDKETETLWSQIEGRGVAGDMTGKKLSVVSSNLVTFQDAKKSSKDLKVLSKNTGYYRKYGSNPYGSYDSHDSLIFPIAHKNERFSAKELFVATSFNGRSVAFHRSDLLKRTQANLEVGGKTLSARMKGNGIIEIYSTDGTVYPHFVSMWFSWANHNTGSVWSDK